MLAAGRPTATMCIDNDRVRSTEPGFLCRIFGRVVQIQEQFSFGDLFVNQIELPLSAGFQVSRLVLAKLFQRDHIVLVRIKFSIAFPSTRVFTLLECAIPVFVDLLHGPLRANKRT